MKAKRFGLSILAAMLFSFQFYAQTNKVTIAPNVLDAAKWAGFEYQKHVDLAKSGNMNALKALLEFNGVVDGVDGIDHAVTCLELIPYVNDITFAGALNLYKPNLKKMLLERLQLAQGRTKNEALQAPLANWAPYTWAVLNGQPFKPVQTAEAGKVNSRKTAKEDMPLHIDKNKTAPSEPQKPDQSNKQ